MKKTTLPPSYGLGMSDSQFKSKFKKKTRKEARNEIKKIEKAKKKHIKAKIKSYYAEKNYQENLAHEMKKWI